MTWPAGASRWRSGRGRKARGLQGGEFTVVVATPAGVARAATPWCKAKRPEQQTCSAVVKPSVIGRDMAVYRAAGEAQTRVETAGWRVVGVRIDAELTGAFAGADGASASDGGDAGRRSWSAAVPWWAGVAG